MKGNVLKKSISYFVTTILVTLLLLMLFFVISSKVSGGEPQAFGYEFKVVLSGSMEPGIKTGSIIAVKPGGDMTRFKKGDVISFKANDNIMITHRISEVIKRGNQISYRTKGDNNNTEDLDSILPSNVLAKYTGFTIPYIGYFVEYSKSKNGDAILLLTLGFIFLGYAALSIWKTISLIERKDKPSC